ncbi:nicotinate phosphoribosyltransferase [Ascoidea rubescens DSM 1968]|uniref:Nicotinate phosphoribosyltransferase n=1 Tax=Ascoidea rubescens DSM 1968 TaxID=1344418 RepID=A0A1D2VCP2_9ASCO|nr:nicotinate phosphoribosyltransferase [Ascoidea rubescens DSM 1968]ODV59332.1 nicotinate phosphoribosyltransferase [Ascoidea rubescens DSM 1968]
MASCTAECVISSLLDTDLYKLTMHAAVHRHFPSVDVEFKYTNRTPLMKFSLESYEYVKSQIELLGALRFTTDEIRYLKKEVSYLPADYFEYLQTFKLTPREHVRLEYDQTTFELSLKVVGKWQDTILYEIPLLAILSQAYFKFVETEWNFDGQYELAKEKCKKLVDHGCAFSEFGTRRRRSTHSQQIVLQSIVDYFQHEVPELKKHLLLGTSNVFFAKKFNLKPIGTVAHEWIMGIAAITGDYLNANFNSLKFWCDTVGLQNAGLALTDTFGTDAFLKNFKEPYISNYIGVRQDSGDPLLYAEKIADFYFNVCKLPKFSKIICFSDSLNVEKCIKYHDKSIELGLKPTFGIGTYFTNDFHNLNGSKSNPLNIVIKLKEIDGKHAIKISDNIGKNMGDAATVQKVKQLLGYQEKIWISGDESHRW